MPSLAPSTASFNEPGETSGKATASLVCGLFFFIFPAAIVAVALGHLSLSEIKKSAGRLRGEGRAIAGLVLGYLGIVSVPFILIIAAIAIPNLLRARIAANEAAAIGSVRVLNTAQIAYSAAHPQEGFTCSLPVLLKDSGEGPELSTGRKHGYVFTLQDCAADNPGEPNTKYQISAYPENYNQTGVRAFCSDESAVIRFNARGSAQACLENGPDLQ